MSVGNSECQEQQDFRWAQKRHTQIDVQKSYLVVVISLVEDAAWRIYNRIVLCYHLGALHVHQDTIQVQWTMDHR